MKRIIIGLFLFISINAHFNYKSDKSFNAKNFQTEVFICNSENSYAFHLYSCSGLKRCKSSIVKISKSDAIKNKYTSCKICYK